MRKKTIKKGRRDKLAEEKEILEKEKEEKEASLKNLKKARRKS